MLETRPVVYFTKEVNRSSLAKLPLKFGDGLAARSLSSFVN